MVVAAMAKGDEARQDDRFDGGAVPGRFCDFFAASWHPVSGALKSASQGQLDRGGDGIVRKLSRSDRALMRSAWADVARAPRALVGRSSATRSACFSAGRRGLCRRCERPINVGQSIRFHSDFADYVHDGCRARSGVTRAARAVTAPKSIVPNTVTRPQRPLCPGCHLVHAGECF